MARTPTCLIRSAAVGMCEVKGQAKLIGDLLISPFSKKTCVYYSYLVEEYRGSDDKSNWQRIAGGSSLQPFYINDGTGDLLIEPKHAATFAKIDAKFSTALLGENDQSFTDGLSTLGINPPSYFSRRLRASESWIAEGDAVYALGPVQINNNAPASATNADNLVMRSQAGYDFILSDKSEKELQGDLGWQEIGLILLGPVISLCSLFVLLKHFMKP